MDALALSWPPVQRVLAISPHGIGSALGFLLGAQLLLREVRRRDLDEQLVVRALTWAAVGAVIGARLEYVLSQPGRFFVEGRSVVDGLVDALQLWRGGLSMFGGFIGGVAAALPILIKGRVHLPRFLDAAAPGFVVGIIIGRIGDLIIGDHLGAPVTGGWAKSLAYTIRQGYELAPGFQPSPAVPGDCTDPSLFFADCTYHLSAGYDLVGALALLGVLLWMRRRSRAAAGVAILLWGAWYGTQRFIIDFTRSHGVDEHIGVGSVDLTVTQILGLVLAMVCTALLVVIAMRGRGLSEAPGDPPSWAGPLLRPAQPDEESSDADSAASSTPSANPLA